MHNKSKVWLPLIFALILVFGIQIGVMLQGSSGKRLLFSSDNESDFDEVLQYIDAKYVDTVNSTKLEQSVIEDLLSRLDPHSIYIPAEKLAVVNQDLMGNFEGIGIEFFRINDTVTVLNVIPNGPSAKAGLEKGDRIVTINDSIATGNKLTDEMIVSKLKGAGNTKVKVGIKRGDAKEIKYFIIVRGTIPYNSIRASFMLTGEIGYIKLERFSNTTYDEFNRAIENLKGQGMKKLILDLRENGGGILEQAIEILDVFIDKNKLLVYTKGRTYTKKEYKAHKEGSFETGGLCILIDEGSASASEIVAGALQDWDRATIIGRRSFGKGLVQEQYVLKDGSALRLTIAKYYTPSGRCIQKPYSDGVEKYYQDIAHRYSHGELTNKDSIPVQDTTRYFTAGGRVVYGGGGIMPDIFVPLDTSYQTELLGKIQYKGWLQEFSYQYAFNHSGQTQPDMTELAVDFSRFLLSKKTNWTDADWGKSSPYILKKIKAYISRARSGDDAYYKLLCSGDENITEALKILQSKK